ncbi:hypothetical protein AB0H71_20095 [Nocardia sp. NPDC050697]|uniref:hypothetical protein n=1 Tax=Nocardia sp. NPDC050697 TaxID=3155158 RepID=UPI0033FD605E
MSGEPEDVQARIARLLRQQGAQVRPEPPTPSPAELRERELIAAEFERIRAQPAPDLLAAARLARRRDQLTGYDRDLTLLCFARTLAERDPVRAGAVAEHIANDQTRGYTLAVIARPDHRATPADPAPAESATQRDPSVVNLSWAATALARSDPERSRAFADRAEALAREITDTEEMDRALPGVAEAVARTNPGRAEEIALTIPDETRRHAALNRIVGALVEFDPDRAEVTARRHLPPEKRSFALMRVALAIAETDPERALALARELTGPRHHALPLAAVARTLAPADPVRATAIAREIHDATQRAVALTALAGLGVPGSNELLVEALSIASWTIPLAAVPIPVFEALLAELTQPAP